MTTIDAPRRAVLYGRVSKLAKGDRARAQQHDRGEGKSVDQQLAELTTRARREGVQIVGPFRDDGISASRFATPGAVREGWRDVMAAIVDGRVGELWVWEVSRATRDRPVWASLIGACTAQRVKISVGGRLHDPTDPDDGFMLDLGAALAVRESAMTSKRIRRDVQARAVAGLPHGKIPYGYLRIYDERTRALLRQEPDPETAPIVQELARRVLAGEAFYALARELNDRGVPSPETARAQRLGRPEERYDWRQDQVRDVVMSPAAAGLRVHQGKVLDGVVAAWAPIISAHDHALLVEKLTDPRRRTYVDGSVRHLLVGIARCGVCGSPMVRRVNRKTFANYMCKVNFCASRKQAWVDQYVTDVVVERLSQPDVLDVFATDDADDVQAAQREVASLRAELAALREAKKSGRISLASFLEFEPDTLAKIADAERRASPAAVPPVLLDVAGPHARDRWDGLAVPQQREAIRALCSVFVDRARQGARSFDPDTIRILWNGGAA